VFKSFIGKRALFALFLFLFSCSPKCPQWELLAIKAHCPPVTYFKAYLPAADTFSGLEAQIVCSGADIRFYLCAKTLQIHSINENLDFSEVCISTQTEQQSFLAERFEGGQRLLLPEEAHQMIFATLLANDPVEITVGRYQATLVPDNFACIYYQMLDRMAASNSVGPH
jgi:hypothetical protein